MMLFIASILNFIVQILGEAFEAGFLVLGRYLDIEKKTEYTAEFTPITEYLSQNNNGFCLDGKNSVNEGDYLSSIVLGQSGSGKTTCVLQPTLYKMMYGNSSLVINDPSTELRTRASGALKQAGFEVIFLDYNSQKSLCYNPLKRCQNISDIQKLSQLLIRNSLGSTGEAFWNFSAESLITFICQYLIKYTDEKYHTLTNVNFLINTLAGNPEAIDKMIVYSKDKQLLAQYKAFFSFGDKTLGSIIATCKAALNFINDEKLGLITSYDNIDFDSFRQRKIALFLNSTTMDMKYYSSISSLFFQQFFSKILSRIPEPTELGIIFLLEEAGSTFLPDLSLVVSNIRKMKSSVLLVYQDEQILTSQYGIHEAQNIKTNCFSKVYLPGQPPNTCKELEQILGRFEYTDKDGRKQLRNLLQADEIRMTDRAIILLGNKKPIHAKLFPFYTNPTYLKYSQLTPILPSNELPFDSPPILSLNHYEKKY